METDVVTSKAVYINVNKLLGYLRRLEREYDNLSAFEDLQISGFAMKL